MHASKFSFGDPVQGDHRQCHHLQVIQTIHSLHSDDRPLSQSLMDEVMDGHKDLVRLKTARERRQRWLVNQRSCKTIAEQIKVFNNDGIPSLIAWGLAFANWSRSDWKRRAGAEVATWLAMPEIILGLQFEAEVGEYFETTYYWHNRPGPFNSRPGFRMMEVHDLYFNFILPWWNDVVDNPESKLKKTMEYLDKNFEGEEKEQRRAQIMRGLKAGREEIIKMTRKSFLEGPVSFLILCDSSIGPAFLRALLAVIAGQAINFIPDACSESWGRFSHDDPHDRPEDEQLWYNQLSKEPEKTLHWWRQFGLHRGVLLDDLQRLSRAEGNETPLGPLEDASKSPLASFKTTYPILYECLEAVFGLMMSNSRLCEQIHGMLRHALRDGTGMAEVDSRQGYAVRTDYEMKAERKNLVADGTSPSRNGAKKMKPNKHSDTKIQVQLLSNQLLKRSADFSREAMAIVDEVPSIREITKEGRRKQDGEQLAVQVEAEKAKRATLTRDEISYEKIQQEARSMKLSNDAVMLLDESVIGRRKKIQEMTVQKFYKDLRPAEQYKQMHDIAVMCFGRISKILHPLNKLPAGKSNKALPLSSKTAVITHVVKPYLDKVNSTCNLIYLYLYGKGPTAVPARDRTLHKMDICDAFLFLRPISEAFGEERPDHVHPEARAIVGSFKTISNHFQPDEETNIDIIDEDDDLNAMDGAIAMEEGA